MPRSVFIIILLAAIGSSYAQEKELHDAEERLKNYHQKDTLRLGLLNDIAFYYSRIDPARGLQSADEAIGLSMALKDAGRLASAYTYKGMNYGSMGDDSLALHFYRMALSLHDKTGNKLRMATCHNNIAISLVNLSEFREALKHHEKAFAIFKSQKDSSRMANSLNNMAVVYLYLNDYRQSLDYNLRALTLFNILNNKPAKANTLLNIGLVYQHLSDLPKALSYQQQAYAIYEKAGDKHGMINSLGNIGNIYHDADSNTRALEYYNRSLDLSNQIGDKRGIASNTSNIGTVYRSIGNYTSALRHFRKALQINEQSGDRKRIASDLNEITLIYLSAPDSVLREENIYDKNTMILSNAQRSLKIGQETGTLDVQRNAWNILHQIYERTGMFRKALRAHKQYMALRDSIINTDVKNDIKKKELQFDFERKEMRLKAEQENRQAAAVAEINRHRLIRNSSITIALVLLASAIASFIFYKRKRDATEKQKAAEFKLKEASSEMDLLLLQMNPHFLFNSLNSINNYMQNNEAEKASQFITRFAKLMRLTLENSRKKAITLASDLYLLEQYLELEILRLKNCFSYEIKIDKKIDPDVIFVPPMLLQPFVENSIWHGVSARPAGGGRINIEVQRDATALRYIVEDNGGGKKENLIKAHGKTSMGIRITENRIQMLNELKSASAALHIVEMENGLRAELVLPYETDNDDESHNYR